MNIDKFIFGHFYKWVAAIAAALSLTATSVMGDCLHCTELCCEGYVTDFGGGNVLYVDLNAGLVKQTIPTGAGAAGIAYVPGQRKMFVSNQNAGTITVIDTETNLTHDIYNDPGSGPVGVILAPDNEHIWVSLTTKNVNGTNGVSAPGALAIFDVATEQLINMISMDEDYSFPLDIQFSNGLVYVVDSFTNNPSLGGDIAVLNAASGHILRHIPVGNGTVPISVAPTPDGQTLYVSGAATSRVLSVNLNTGATTSIPTDAGPYKLNINRLGTHVWSSNYIGNTVSKISTLTNTVVAAIPVPGSPFISTLSPLDNILYSVDLDNASITVINAFTNVVERVFSIGEEDETLPIQLAIVQVLRIQP